MFGATLVSGLLLFLMAPVFEGKLLKFFPPLVSGTVVTCMGLSLIPVAIRWAGGVPGTPSFGNFQNISLALITLIIIVVIQKLSKGFLGNISNLNRNSFRNINSNIYGSSRLASVATADFVNINTPLKYGIKFDITAILSLFLVQLVIMTDATGNQLNLQIFVV